MATENEHAELTRAAKVRAAFLAYLNHHRGEKFTQRELIDLHSEMIKELQYSDSSVYAVLASMVQNEMIHAEKADDGITNVYYVNGVKPRVVQAEAALKPVKQKAVAPAVSIDYVQSTGKIRVTMQGMTIDFGVVEK